MSISKYATQFYLDKLTSFQQTPRRGLRRAVQLEHSDFLKSGFTVEVWLTPRDHCYRFCGPLLWPFPVRLVFSSDDPALHLA
jgi:hypothetical protein